MLLDKYLQRESISVVFIGDFNPVVLQPYWISNKGFIREEEAAAADVNIIHNEIVKYDLNWVSIEISKQRCEFKTKMSPYFDSTKDLSLNVFRTLNETPIRALGINYIIDLGLPNKDNYYDFGNFLTPLKPWQEELNNPRLLQLEILEKVRKDGLKGQYRVRIMPAEDISFGIRFNINDHFELSYEKYANSEKLLDLLEQNWDISIKRAKDVVNKILKQANL